MSGSACKRIKIAAHVFFGRAPTRSELRRIRKDMHKRPTPARRTIKPQFSPAVKQDGRYVSVRSIKVKANAERRRKEKERLNVEGSGQTPAEKA